MRKVFMVFMSVVLLAGLSGVALATPAASKTAGVYVNIIPHVELATPIVTGNTQIQTGKFSLTASFLIDANQQQIKIGASASPLFKGDIYTNPSVAPILLSDPEGIVVVCELANPMNGHASKLVYVGPDTELLDGYPGSKTESVAFESSQNNRFSQRCSLTPTWIQDWAERPQGQYSGKVKIYVSTVL